MECITPGAVEPGILSVDMTISCPNKHWPTQPFELLVLAVKTHAWGLNYMLRI